MCVYIYIFTYIIPTFTISRWWFQTCFMFTHILATMLEVQQKFHIPGEMIQFDSILFKWVVQPPTRHGLWEDIHPFVNQKHLVCVCV